MPAPVQFDDRLDGQLGALLVREASDVAELEHAVVHRPPRLGIEGLEVDAERDQFELRSRVVELVCREPAGHHDGVEGLGEPTVQAADHRLHAE